MPPCIDQFMAKGRTTTAALAALTLSATLLGCSPQTDTAAPQPRPVRTTTVEQREAGVPITLTPHRSRGRGCTRIPHFGPGA